MVTKQTNAHKYIKVCYIILYYKPSIPPTCFGHSCSHPQWGALQRILSPL